MSQAFGESVVEHAARTWLAKAGWQVKHGEEIASGEAVASRGDYGEVVQAVRLRAALTRLNPRLLPEALNDALRRLTRPEGPAPDGRAVGTSGGQPGL